MWVFGYGSLIWNADFPYEERCVGFVKGFARRFWQGSIDHRGVPEAPGRVVTLVEDEQGLVWGIAYKLPQHQVQDVVAHLDYREKCGYCASTVVFHPKDSRLNAFEVRVYLTPAENPWFLGPAPLEDIAAEIATRCGPNGRNAEYLLKLAESMRSIAPDHQDDHVFGLEKKVREILCLQDDDELARYMNARD